MLEEKRFTLREIAGALAETMRAASETQDAVELHERARMLRDRGLIKTSSPQRQGRTTTYSEADVVAAVIAITASLNGQSWGIIEAINGQLRAIGNTVGRPEYEWQLAAIKADEPIFVRLDICNYPWGFTNARLDTLSALGLDKLGDDLPVGTTQILVMPVTAVAKPVLDLLLAGSDL